MEKLNGTWRTIAVSLASAIIAFGAAWFTFGMNSISRVEVLRLVETQTPYAKDQNFVHGVLESNTAMLDSLVTEVTALKVEQARMATALEQLHKELEAHETR